MLPKYPILTRFLSKLLCEFLPATIVSAIGAVLLSHYARPSATTPPAIVADPASAEMLQMARDEHARIVIYMEKNGEARQLADIAAEKELTRMKAAEQAAILAAQKARASETRVAALAASVTDKSAKKVLAKQLAHRPVGTAVVQEPLQLSDVANVTEQTQPVAQTTRLVAPAAHRGDNLFVTKWREATETVERIPMWVRSMVAGLTDNIPSPTLPHVRPLHII